MQTIIRQSSSYLIVAFLTLDYTRRTEQLLILIGVLFAPLYNFLRGLRWVNRRLAPAQRNHSHHNLMRG